MNEKFNKVIIWGYPLHSHTHSYIHAAFEKAFKYLGYPTYWFKDGDSLAGVDCENALYIAMGDQEKDIPLNKTSYYVLHNVDGRRYVAAGCKILFIQTHTSDATQYIKEGDPVFNNYTFLLKGEIDCLCMCWATDLLPHEIDTNISNVSSGKCVWIGTYGDSTGLYQNGTELMPFFEAAERKGIPTIKINPWSMPITFEENMRLVREAYIAPSIQGPWQIDHRYIPCRIFKNISYGNFGVTNSAAVNEVFGGKLVYDRNSTELFHKAVAKRNDPNYITELVSLMNEVKEKHTYLNRIEDIIKCLP